MTAIELAPRTGSPPNTCAPLSRRQATAITSGCPTPLAVSHLLRPQLSVLASPCRQTSPASVVAALVDEEWVPLWLRHDARGLYFNVSSEVALLAGAATASRVGPGNVILPNAASQHAEASSKRRGYSNGFTRMRNQGEAGK